MHTEILFFFRFFFPILSDCPSTAAAFPRCCTRQHTHIRTRKREEENEGKVYVCVCAKRSWKGITATRVKERKEKQMKRSVPT